MLSLEMRSGGSCTPYGGSFSLCFNYLHENRENKRIIGVGGLEEWVVDRF